MAIRKSVRALTDAEKQTFTDAVRALKQERDAPDSVSTYDQYVVTHARAMARRTPWPGDLMPTLLGRVLQDPLQNIQDQFRRFLTTRNAAHRGPCFLPWHREFLRRFEADLQRISGNPDLGLPYWDWETDGALPLEEQRNTQDRSIWQLLGGDGDPQLLNMVTTGPFAFDQTRLEEPTVFTDPDVWLTVDSLGRQMGFLQRAMGRGQVAQRNAAGEVVIDPATGNPVLVDVTLPTKPEVDASIEIPIYDVENWDNRSDPARSFRNVLEGWILAPGLHNRVHVWVGGSMGPGTSPNDPVFFLHHANIDRIWELWRQRGHPAGLYAPMNGGPDGHNLNDVMFPWDGQAHPDQVTVAQASDLGNASYEPVPPA